MALPAVEAIRSVHPFDHLIGMVRAEHFDFARRISAFDEIISAPSGRGLRRVPLLWRAVQQLRSARPDVAVVMAPSFEAALISWLARVPRRIGSKTDARGFLLTDVVSMPSDCHRRDEFFALVDVLGAEVDTNVPCVALEAHDRAYVDRLFHNCGWLNDICPIFINPAAAKLPRAWSAKRFEDLVLALRLGNPQRQIILHNRAPFELSSDWASIQGVLAVGDTTLPQLCALLERCSLYIGNDSGPAHLAALFGVPTITLFGPSTPLLTGPRPKPGVSAIDLTAAFPCSPCRERFYEECPSPPSLEGCPPCLEAISVRQVIDKAEHVLSGRVMFQ